MNLLSWAKSHDVVEGLARCHSTRHKVIYTLRQLHKIKDDFEFTNRGTIEECLDQVSMRYREVKLDKSFSNFDFGIILVIRVAACEYSILNRYSGEVQSFKVSDTASSVSILDDSHLSTADQDIAFEVYPSLPYQVNNISEFLSFVFSEYTSDLFKLVVFTTFSQSVKALFPMLTVYVTTTVVSIGSVRLTYYIGFLALCLSLFATVSLYLQARIIQKIESETDKRAQTAVWDRLMKIDLGYISPFKSADLVSRAASISQVRTLMSSQNITSLIALLFSVIYLLEMSYYLPVPTLAVLPLLIVYISIIIFKARSGGSLLTGSLEANADLSDLSNSIFKGFGELRSAHALTSIKRLWTQSLHRSARFAYLYRQKDNSLDVLSNSFLTLSFLISFIAILALDSKLLADPLFISKAIGYTSALTIFGATLSAGTVTIVNSLISVLAYWKRAQPIAFSPIEAGYNLSCYPVSIEGNVSIQDISFSYASDLPAVLRDFSLSILSGKINRVFIQPGEGTSTLFRLLLGLYSISSGFIHYDAHNIENILVSSLRSQVKLAPQSLNIPMGNIYKLFRGPLSSTDDALSEFVEAFGLSSFISSLRMSIDTPLGNNGKNFPEKQRQLFSLAYACSQSPKLLLVDNCLGELSIDEKTKIFSFLLKKGITVAISDRDSEALSNLS
ncbi:MAG: ATP-binding cassette domain-containing protein [Cyanobacteriota bacterium]